jgi:hypothetical protein
MSKKSMESNDSVLADPKKLAKKISGSNRPGGSSDPGNQDLKDLFLKDNDRPGAGVDSNVDLNDLLGTDRGPRVFGTSSDVIMASGTKKQKKVGSNSKSGLLGNEKESQPKATRSLVFPPKRHIHGDSEMMLQSLDPEDMEEVGKLTGSNSKSGLLGNKKESQSKAAQSLDFPPMGQIHCSSEGLAPEELDGDMDVMGSNSKSELLGNKKESQPKATQSLNFPPILLNQGSSKGSCDGLVPEEISVNRKFVGSNPESGLLGNMAVSKSKAALNPDFPPDGLDLIPLDGPDTETRMVEDVNMGSSPLIRVFPSSGCDSQADTYTSANPEGRLLEINTGSSPQSGLLGNMIGRQPKAPLNRVFPPSGCDSDTNTSANPEGRLLGSNTGSSPRSGLLGNMIVSEPKAPHDRDYPSYGHDPVTSVRADTGVTSGTNDSMGSSPYSGLPGNMIVSEPKAPHDRDFPPSSCVPLTMASNDVSPNQAEELRGTSRKNLISQVKMIPPDGIVPPSSTVQFNLLRTIGSSGLGTADVLSNLNPGPVIVVAKSPWKGTAGEINTTANYWRQEDQVRVLSTLSPAVAGGIIIPANLEPSVMQAGASPRLSTVGGRGSKNVATSSSSRKGTKVHKKATVKKPVLKDVLLKHTVSKCSSDAICD